MAARSIWTDDDVATLNAAHWYMRLGDHGVLGFAHFRPHRRSWITAVMRYGEAVQGSGDLPQARRHLRRIAYRIASIESIEPTIKPEDTLRAAGIGTKRQREYQRKMSMLLGKGAPCH